MSKDDADADNVIELRAALGFPDACDSEKVTTVEAFGTVLEFRQPPTRAKDVQGNGEQRVFIQKKRRWEWYKGEIAVGFSVRHDHGGQHVVVGVEDNGGGIYEIWLPTENVGKKFNYGADAHATLMERLSLTVNSAREVADKIRREPAAREVIAEAVGEDGAWRLVRATMPRDGMRDEVWWEVTGGKKCPRLYSGAGAESDEEDARRDYAQHRPAWGCKERPADAIEHSTPGGVWRSWGGRENEPCRRKANHAGEHRNRAGIEWSAWPYVEHVAIEFPQTSRP